MIFTYEDKIRANDLAFDYREQLIGVTAERIREDDELMNRVDAFCRIELAEYEGKFTLEQLIDLKVEELAEEAVSRIRIYASFDIEVENI
jgi:hypothetical protein